MTQAVKAEVHAGENPDGGQEYLAGSAKAFWVVAILIVLILGSLLLFRFGSDIKQGVLAGIGLADASSAANDMVGPILYRTLTIIVLSLFVPFTAFSYIITRRRIRKRELQEVCYLLGIDYSYFAGIYNRDTRDSHFLYAVMFTFVITILGLTAVILGAELGLNKVPNLLLRGPTNNQNGPGQEVYQLGSLLFFGLAFLGAYLWGLQEILRRYFTNDLVPGVYYTLGVRMIFAAIVALLVFHIIGQFGSESGLLSSPEKIGGTILPLIAFAIGIFPQRALQYFTDKISMFTRTNVDVTNDTPLDLIQGVSVYNRMRLREVGIDSCFDLAHADFMRMLFTTPFPAKQLIDWILQAKLCVFFPDGLDDLRQYGIRSVEQLRLIDSGPPDILNTLASDTKLTQSALQLAKREADADKAVEQLLTYREYLDSIEKIRGDRDTALGIKKEELASQSNIAAE